MHTTSRLDIAALLFSSFTPLYQRKHRQIHIYTHTHRRRNFYKYVLEKFENPKYALWHDWPGDTKGASQVVHQAVLSGTSQP